MTAAQCEDASFGWMVDIGPMISSPMLRRVYAGWRQAADGARMPLRRLFDVPMALRNDLGAIGLIDVDHDAHRLRYRVVGSDLVEHRRTLKPMDPTGYYVDQVSFYSDRSMIEDAYWSVVTAEQPFYTRLPYQPAYGHGGWFHWLILPVTLHGDRCDQLLFAADYPDRRPLLGDIETY